MTKMKKMKNQLCHLIQHYHWDYSKELLLALLALVSLDRHRGLVVPNRLDSLPWERLAIFHWVVHLANL